MAALCEGGNEPPGSLKAICNRQNPYTIPASANSPKAPLSVRGETSTPSRSASGAIAEAIHRRLTTFHGGRSREMAARAELIALVRVGYSASSAAREIGIPLTTAKRWAKLFLENNEISNRPIPGRPRIYTREEDAISIREYRDLMLLLQ
ncbi:hypothetical protein ANN_11385 [Periplaneta americana]|uniref:Uncharacterized protein n=1 Tax=Periplaneta americana TaxID=6978 RepID=A0ABQ8T686_PERAM|nr:hypothetical protein ANN_11385 [Periplaneta americana]